MHVTEDPRFKEHLMSPTALEVLLRGHLWAESELIGVLEDVLPYPERIDLSRLGFPLKVTLLAAHGFLRPEDIPAFLKLNSLRNKVAHNLHAELGEESVNELLATFDIHLRRMYGNGNPEPFIKSGEVLWVGRLRAAIACLCILLSGERERIAKQRQKERELHARYLALVERVTAYKETE